MKSMTGFGRATAGSADWDAAIDISSVNRKGLEISCSLPRQWQGAELQISQKVKEFFTRGKVCVGIKFNFKKTPKNILPGADFFRDALRKLKDDCAVLGVQYSPTVETLIELSRDLEADTFPDFSQYQAKIEPALMAALSQINSMRETEGEALKADFERRLGVLQGLVSKIKDASKNTVSNYRDSLLARLKNLGLELDISDERVLKELAIFADRCDICEEITRLESHISQFFACLNSSENCGRKMDFICQELGREINTIASKANNLALSKLAIDFKNELERIREQAQNVE